MFAFHFRVKCFPNFLFVEHVGKLSLTFFHISVGSGLPLGGPHSSNAVSPAATRVSLGSTRKSSRKTANQERERENNDLDFGFQCQWNEQITLISGERVVMLQCRQVQTEAKKKTGLITCITIALEMPTCHVYVSLSLHNMPVECRCSIPVCSCVCTECINCRIVIDTDSILNRKKETIF